MNMRVKCCCGGGSVEPCVDCGVTQVVTIVFLQGGGTDCEAEIAGPWTLAFWEDSETCEWYRQQNHHSVSIVFNKLTRKWRVYVTSASGAVCTLDFDSGWQDDLFACVGGKLVGVVDMWDVAIPATGQIRLTAGGN